jgi:hypothetical protein
MPETDFLLCEAIFVGFEINTIVYSVILQERS